jgi:hypothetical protein
VALTVLSPRWSRLAICVFVIPVASSCRPVSRDRRMRVWPRPAFALWHANEAGDHSVYGWYEKARCVVRGNGSLRAGIEGPTRKTSFRLGSHYRNARAGKLPANVPDRDKAFTAPVVNGENDRVGRTGDQPIDAAQLQLQYARVWGQPSFAEDRDKRQVAAAAVVEEVGRGGVARWTSDQGTRAISGSVESSLQEEHG